MGEYRDGRMHGRSVLWFRTGVRHREGEFSLGAREGAWRKFHPSGALAEEAHYRRGKLHGQRRRFFESGRQSLDANYENGVPTGTWRAFYDVPSSQLALTATLNRGREQQEVIGALPDGSVWKGAPIPEPCPEEAKCQSPLQSLDLEALPPLVPAPCPWGSGRNASGKQLARIIEAARGAWPDEENSLGPTGCVEGVRLECAPNLDGEGEAEVLAEVRYRIYQSECSSAEAKEVQVTQALVALSPPSAGQSSFGTRGFIGYRNFHAPGVEGPSYLEAIAFVRLPNGQAAVRVVVSTDGGSCGGGLEEQILLLRDSTWSVVKLRTLNACNQAREPEESDHF